MRPGSRVDVTAERLDEAGAGVGVSGGTTVHARDLLPGERGAVAIEHVSPHRAEAWGSLAAREGPVSEARVAPPCPAFGRCGGCAWQHLAYAAQLTEKRARVARALGDRLGGLGVPAVAPAPNDLGYRTRAKYVVGRDGARVVLGAYAPRTHAIVDTLGCRVVTPAIDALARRARDAIQSAVDDGALTPYDERARTGDLRYLVVREGIHGGLLAGVVTTSAADPAAVRALADDLGGDVDVVRVVNDATRGVILTDDVEVVRGTGTARDEVAGVVVDLGIGAFTQVNRAQAERLYRDVAALAVDDSTGAGAVRAIDLYAGVGGIAFALAGAGAEVVAIERDESAVTAGGEAVQRAGMRGVRFVHGDASTLAELDDGADVVVVDPPRKGLTAEVAGALLALAPARIVYVSCAPGALARDLDALAPAYAPRALRAYDLMPGTAQVEVVCVLQRVASGGAPPSA